MTEDVKQFEYMQSCPTEVIVYIFTFLKPKQLTKCREVCWRWKHIVDSLFRSDLLWRKYCESDFANVYKVAYYKCKRELSWCNLYRSLSLWSKLEDAIESQDEFASASCLREEIRDFQVMRHGEIGVHTRRGVVYYDIKTFKPSNRGVISGDYLRYLENDEVIIILGFTLDLYVFRKILKSPLHESDGSFSSVKNFLLNNNILYYVTLDNFIHICNLNDEQIESKVFIQIPDGIMCLGYNNDRLHALTFQRDIFSVVGNDMVFQSTLNSTPNLLHILNEYNFLEHLDWRVYFQWMFVLNHTIPQGSIRDIIVVKMYGHMVFVGSSSGVFRIYRSPYTDAGFDLFTAEPIKQYNFTERTDCPVLATSPIIQIDVLEGVDSHTVLVGMPKKIAVLNFNHTISGSNSILKFTPDKVQNVKTVDIVDPQ